jgi:rfaE bifunctional protein kinase chain/domain
MNGESSVPAVSNALSMLIDALAGHQVLVVGDLVLDEYLIGHARRLSREAPIPVLEYERAEYIPGGACNPAVNVAALGGRAAMVGVVGQDAHADALRALLAARGVDPRGIVSDPSRQTTTKTRVMAHMGLRFPQQVARIDRVTRAPVDGPAGTAIQATIRAWAAQIQPSARAAIMLSDYLNGLITPALTEAVRAAGPGLLLAADAQGDLGKYHGFALVKCNADEAARYVGRALATDADFAAAGAHIVGDLALREAMLITRGAAGITLVERERGAAHIPAPHVEDVFDTVGAGDTVLAVVALARLAGAGYPDAARLANLAAGVVIRKVGNYAPTPADLRAALE